METKEIKNPVKAIRRYCLECCLESSNEVKLCSVEKCPLHPFRLGKNPYRAAREYTEEERVALRDRLQKAREAKTCHNGDICEN